MKKIFVILSISLIVCSCATQAEKAQARQNQIEYYKAQCYNYGYRDGTAEYSNCVMQLDLQEQQRQQAVVKQIMDNQIKPVPYIPKQPVRTNCYINGAYTNCTSQ